MVWSGAKFRSGEAGGLSSFLSAGSFGRQYAGGAAGPATVSRNYVPHIPRTPKAEPVTAPQPRPSGTRFHFASGNGRWTGPPRRAAPDEEGGTRGENVG